MYPNSAVVVKDLRIQAGCGATLSTTLQGPQLGQTTPVRMSEAQWQNLFPLRHLRRPFSRRSHQQLRPRNPRLGFARPRWPAKELRARQLLHECLADSNKPCTRAKPTNKPVCTPVVPPTPVVQIGAASVGKVTDAVLPQPGPRPRHRAPMAAYLPMTIGGTTTALEPRPGGGCNKCCPTAGADADGVRA